MAGRHYEVNNKGKQIIATVEKLTENEKSIVKNYIDLGYELIAKEKKTKKLSEEERKENPFSSINVQKFLKENGTDKQQKEYWSLYNEQATDKKTGKLSVYKTDDKKNGKFKKGDPKPKGHIATMQWFKKEFPNYPNNK